MLTAAFCLLTKTNAGKAEALNYALKYTKDEIYVGIDADTVIAPNAISILVPHFADAKVAAVAGNAKVGQPRESLDALAGAGIHHQPEF